MACTILLAYGYGSLMKRNTKNLCRCRNLRHILLLLVFLVSFCGCAAVQSVKTVARSGFYHVKYNLTGTYYLDNEKYKEGIEAFSKEIETNPENVI